MSTLVKAFYTNPLILSIPANPVLGLYYKTQNLLINLLNWANHDNTTTFLNIGKLEISSNTLDGQYTAHLFQEPSATEVKFKVSKSLSSSDNGGRGRKKFNKKKAALIAGLVSGIIGIIVSIFVVLPGILIHNISDILTRKVGALQTHQSINYRRKTMPRIKDVFSRNGRIGSKIMRDMGREGYSFQFNDPINPNKITGVWKRGKLIPNNESGLASKEIESFIDARHPFAISRWKTRRMRAFYERFGIHEISPVGLKNLKPGETPEQIANKQAFDEIDEGVHSSSIAPDTTDTSGLSSEQKAARSATLADAENITENKGLFSKLRSKLKQGVTVAGTEEAAALEQTSSGVVGEALDKTIAKSLKSGLGKRLTGFKDNLTISGTLSRICTVNRRLGAVAIASRVWRSRAMIRYAANFIKASDGVKKGAVSMALLAVMLRRISSVDSSGANIGSSSGFSYALKNKFSRSRNNVTRSSIAVDGKLGGIYGGIQKKTSITGCRVWRNPLTQIAEGVVSIAIAIFTSPAPGASEAAEATTLQGIKFALKESVNKAITNFSLKTALWSAGSLVARTAAVELSFEGIMTLTQMYAEKSLSLNFTGQESGAFLGNILVGGAGGMSKQRSLIAGQVPATVEQYAQANTKYLAEKKSELSKESFYARIFDYNNLDSLAFAKISSIPMSVASAGISTRSAITGILQSPLSLFGSIVGVALPKASAATGDEVAFDTYVTQGDMNSGIKLATDPSGNLLTVMPQDIANIDPDTNTAFLSAKGYLDSAGEPMGVFKEHVKNCVENIDTLSVIEGADQTDPATDCLATQPITKKFKAYLAYQDMMDGLEAEFLPQTLDSTTSVGAGDGTTFASIPNSGEVRSLAQQVLNNSNIYFLQTIPRSTLKPARVSVQRAANGEFNQMETRCLTKGEGPRNGQLTTLDTTLSPVLLNLMLQVAKDYKVGYGYTTNGCHSTGPGVGKTDNHYNGRAVDINYVDGAKVNGDNNSRKFMQYLANILPDGSVMAQAKNCFSDWKTNPIKPANDITFIGGDACTHIHISVPRGTNTASTTPTGGNNAKLR